MYYLINKSTKKRATKPEVAFGVALERKDRSVGSYIAPHGFAYAKAIKATWPEYNPETHQLKQLPDEVIEVDGVWSITYNRREVVEAIKVVPHKAETWKLEIVLLGAGYDVNAKIDAIEDPQERAVLKIAFNKANYVYRNHELTYNLQSKFGIGDELADQLFIEAENLYAEN